MPLIKLAGHLLKECPLSYIEDWTQDVLDLFYLCTSVTPGFGSLNIMRHSLPESGGLLEQSNFLMEAFSAIESSLISSSKKGK